MNDPTSNAPPFVLDHVAFGLPDVEPAGRVLAGQLGGQPLEGGRGPGFGFWQWRFREDERIEVISPQGPPDGFVHRFLERRGPGVHHVTFKVASLAAALAHVRGHGVEVVGHDESNPGWKEAFLHPKQAHGIVVQLAEAEPYLDETIDPGLQFPGGPPATNPARIHAVVLSMHDAETAKRQWAELLGGHLEPGSDRLQFSWPGSRVNVCVEIDPGVPEGPLALEVECDALPADTAPHPTLGVVLRRIGP